jgi:benzoate 4-monooxygenase
MLIESWRNSLAEIELRVLLAAFFLRFDASVDSSSKDEDMELYDSFSASPVGGKFLLNLRERP